MTREVILVPRRSDGGIRDDTWTWVRAWWEREQSHMPIIEGHHEEGLFNRSMAVNRAARLAGDWEVAVIIDADVICDPARVKQAVLTARETGSMVLPHDMRHDLNAQGSRLAMGGYPGSWRKFAKRHYPDMVSSVVVVPRRLWDEVGGFDEEFRGWGFEDNAFAAACATFGGIIRMTGEFWHFWHPTNAAERQGTESWVRNHARGQRYRTAIGDKDAIRRLQQDRTAPLLAGIPRILHRTVPVETTPDVERFWEMFRELHPDWTLMTHRDPLEAEKWPETADLWGRCRNGAELADLVRLEALWRWGGVYVDSDCEPFRPLDSLLGVPAFAAWEDHRSVPNAVIGAAPGHPAIRKCLDLARERIDRPTWDRGPGITTEVFVGRSDVLLLPPGSFYPYHYRELDRADEDFRKLQPWAFMAHRWAGSWLTPEQKAANQPPKKRVIRKATRSEVAA